MEEWGQIFRTSISHYLEAQWCLWPAKKACALSQTLRTQSYWGDLGRTVVWLWASYHDNGREQHWCCTLHRFQSKTAAVSLLPLKSHLSPVVNANLEPPREWNSRKYSFSWSKLTQVKPPQEIPKTLWIGDWDEQIEWVPCQAQD